MSYGVHGLQKLQISEKRFKVLHAKKFKIKLDNSFILTHGRRCTAHRAKNFYQDDLEHLFVFVYAKLFLLYTAKEPSLKVHVATLAAISTII